MEIRKVETDKKEYLPLLLLADEQEDMIDQYLERGDMYVLEDGGVKAVCVVTDEGNGALEIKNLAVIPESQGKGYGRHMIRFVLPQCRFMRNAGSAGLMWSGTFSRIITIILSMREAYSLLIWFI